MAHINIDLGSMGGEDELHPDGPMRLKLVSYEKREKNDKSGEYLSWRADPGDDIALRRPIWFNTSLTNLTGIKALMKAVGYKPGPDGFDPDDMLGGEFIAKVGTEVYNDVPKNTINFPYQKVSNADSRTDSYRILYGTRLDRNNLQGWLVLRAHETVIAQLQFIKINPDRSLSWTGQLPAPPEPPAKAEKK